MTTFELLQAFEDFLSAAQNAGHLRDALAQLSPIWDEILALTADTPGLTENNQVLQKNNQARSRADQAAHQLRQFSPSKIFLELDAFRRSISAVHDRMQRPDRETMHRLPELATKFHDAYENALKNYDRPAVIRLLAVANDFYSSIVATQQIVMFLKANLELAPAKDEDTSDVELFLPSPSDLESIVSKLEALATLYQELCELLAMPNDDRVFEVLRVETGSLFVRGRGKNKVIDLLVDLLREGASYLYRRYTQEGQISSIPKKVESLDAVLDLSKRLRKMGLDTTTTDANLQKSAAVIAGQLNRLLAGEGSIVLNRQSISVATVVEAPRLKAPPLQIEQRETTAERDEAAEGTDDKAG
jgi:hypothetical protein